MTRSIFESGHKPVKAVLDANLFFTMWIIDPLLSFAEDAFFQPVWSERIMSEVRTHLNHVWSDVPQTAVDRYLDAINQAFPDSMVRGWERHVDGIHLPDVNDRHVLAAAIESGAIIIVTENLRDFPMAQTRQYGVTPMDSDTFLSECFTADPHGAYAAICRLIDEKHHPPRTMDAEIDTLQQLGLRMFVQRLSGCERS